MVDIILKLQHTGFPEPPTPPKTTSSPQTTSPPKTTTSRKNTTSTEITTSPETTTLPKITTSPATATTPPTTATSPRTTKMSPSTLPPTQNQRGMQGRRKYARNVNKKTLRTQINFLFFFLDCEICDMFLPNIQYFCFPASCQKTRNDISTGMKNKTVVWFYQD